MNPIVFALRHPVTVMVGGRRRRPGQRPGLFPHAGGHFPQPQPARHLRRPALRRPRPGPDGRPHHQLLRVPFPLHQRHRSRRVEERPGHGPDEALLPPRHQHGPGHGRDRRLHQPRPLLHAAGDRAALRHALRHRQRAGRLPRPPQRHQNDRPDPGPGPVQGPAHVRQPARRVGPAAVRRQPAHRRRPRGPRPPAGLRRFPRRRGRRPCPRATRSAPRATSASRTRCPSCRWTPWSCDRRTWARSPCGPDPTSTSATWATIEDSTDIPTGYALVNGRRAVYILVTKRAEASTIAVVNEVKKNLPKMQAVLPDDIALASSSTSPPTSPGPCGASARRA